VRHYTNCSDWGYDLHPRRAEVASRCAILTRLFVDSTRRFDKYHFDTRRAHAYFFQGMTPAECRCILGQYRGTPDCKHLEVNVHAGGDPLVGVPYQFVAHEMKVFEARCAALLKVHAKWFEDKGKNQAPRNALLKFVELAAAVLELFLTIHPYMDGNGHCARMLVYLMMVRAGYPPTGWNVDAKQPSAYGEALAAHRRGKKGALQMFLLEVIARPRPDPDAHESAAEVSPSPGTAQ
jgi:fido (protein-threonine AMPylation protein)